MSAESETVKFVVVTVCMLNIVAAIMAVIYYIKYRQADKAFGTASCGFKHFLEHSNYGGFVFTMIWIDIVVAFFVCVVAISKWL